MPPEIIEAIFTYAPNIGLPLSSPLLGRILANEKMFTECASTWFKFKSAAPSGDISSPRRHRELEVATVSPAPEQDTAPYQAGRLLSCRWMTWPRFKNILRNTVFEIDVPGHDKNDDNIPRLNFDHPWEQPNLPILALGPSVHIPEKLLRAPWSSEKSMFLYYLCFLGLRVDWAGSTAGEVATDGLKDAIKARDRRAVIALLSAQVSVLPSQGNLRSAIIDHGCDQTIVFHLLNACLSAKSKEHEGLLQYGSMTVNALDALIWSWLKRYENAGNEKAAWLKKALRTAASMMHDTATSRAQKYQDLKAACGRHEHGVEEIPLPSQQSLNHE